RDALPRGPELAAMMGKFQFLVEGWDHDPQEIWAIPEVRKFYQTFHRVWPYCSMPYICNVMVCNLLRLFNFLTVAYNVALTRTLWISPRAVVGCRCEAVSKIARSE
ncbi:MAG: hypothetical protein WCP35_10975, partial [Verrucomicrobiota bacterium]